MAEGRPRRPRFLGFDPSRRPTTPGMCLAHREVATPLGLALLGFAREGLGRDSARPPLTRFGEPAMNASAARRLRVSIDLRLTLLLARRASTYEQDQGNPYRVSAPSAIPDHSSSGPRSWLWVHLSPCRTLLPANRRSSDRTPPLYRSCRDWLRCLAFATLASQ